MRKGILALALATLAVAACAPKTGVSSPDGRIAVSIHVEDGVPSYSVSVDGRSVILPSGMGLQSGDADLSGGFRITGSGSGCADEKWTQPWGENKEITDRHNSLTVNLRNDSGVKLAVEFRVFDDGAAFRYTYDVPSVDSLRITGENTAFRFAQDGDSWSIPGSFDTYEFLYRKMPLSEVKDANTPFTVRFPDGLHLSIHEAALIDFPEMVLRSGEDPLAFTAELAPLRKRSGLRAVVPSHFSTPWRTLQIADRAVGLVNSSMILNLNEPCAIEDVSWIRPMKYIGVWWGMHLGIENWEGYRHGATTERALEYIDFAVENNIQGVLFEGWNNAWRGSSALPDFDFTQAAPDFEVEKVAAYAREKGISLITHNETGGNYVRFAAQLDRDLDWAQSLGIHGLKTGYAGGGLVGGVPRHSQTGNVHFHDVVRKAAERQIMVDGHEVIKPTGVRRTWPNFMTRECVRGMEYNGWSAGNPPSHHEILPYTRLLGGPVDYTPGVFDILYRNIQGRPQVREWGRPGTECRIHTTLCKQIANWVVLYSPMQMACDLIENYEGHPAFQFFRDFDADCDESRALQGEVGEYISLYRRAGAKYFYAATTDESARTLVESLDFLASGVTYEAVIYADAVDADWQANPLAYEITRRTVTSADTLTVHLAPGGGQAVTFIPVGE
jgi:alpha-glucosidase